MGAISVLNGLAGWEPTLRQWEDVAREMAVCASDDVRFAFLLGAASVLDCGGACDLDKVRAEMVGELVQHKDTVAGKIPPKWNTLRKITAGLKITVSASDAPSGPPTLEETCAAVSDTVRALDRQSQVTTSDGARIVYSALRACAGLLEEDHISVFAKVLSMSQSVEQTGTQSELNIRLMGQIVNNSSAKGDASACLTLLDTVMYSCGLSEKQALESIAGLIHRQSFPLVSLVNAVVGGDPRYILALLESLIRNNSHYLVFNAREAEVNKVLSMCQLLMDNNKLPYDMLLAEKPLHVVLNHVCTLIEERNLHIPTIAMSVCRDKREFALRTIEGLCTQFNVVAEEAMPLFHQSVIKKERISSVGNLIRLYELDWFEAVVGLQEERPDRDSLILFVKSIIKYFSLEIHQVVDISDKRPILKLLKVFNVAAQEVVRELHTDIKDVCFIIETIIEQMGVQEKKTRVRNEVGYLLEYFEIGLQNFLQLYNFNAGEVATLMQASKIECLDLCSNLWKLGDTSSVTKLCGDLIAKFQIPAFQALEIINPAQLTAAHIFRYFRIDPTNAINTLHEVYNVSLAEVLPLFKNTESTDVANMLRKYRCEISDVLAESHPSKEEAVSAIHTLIKQCQLGISDIIKVLKFFPFGVVDIAKHYRVNVIDVHNIIKHFQIQIEDIVDNMVAGKSKEEVVKSINSIVLRNKLSITDITAVNTNSFAAVAATLYSRLQICSMEDIGDYLGKAFVSASCMTQADTYKVVFLFGFLAAVAKFKHPDYLEPVLRAAAVTELPLKVSQMLDMVRFTFPTGEVGCHTSPSVHTRDVQATAPVTCSGCLAVPEVSNMFSQATLHCNSVGLQTYTAVLADIGTAYVVLDFSTEVACQASPPIAERASDACRPDSKTISVTCDRMPFPTVTQSAQVVATTRSVESHAQCQTSHQSIQSEPPQCRSQLVQCKAESKDASLLTRITPPMLDRYAQCLPRASVDQGVQPNGRWECAQSAQTDSCYTYAASVQAMPDCTDTAAGSPIEVVERSVGCTMADRDACLQIQPDVMNAACNALVLTPAELAAGGKSSTLKFLPAPAPKFPPSPSTANARPHSRGSPHSAGEEINSASGGAEQPQTSIYGIGHDQNTTTVPAAQKDTGSLTQSNAEETDGHGVDGEEPEPPLEDQTVPKLSERARMKKYVEDSLVPQAGKARGEWRRENGVEVTDKKVQVFIADKDGKSRLIISSSYGESASQTISPLSMLSTRTLIVEVKHTYEGNLVILELTRKILNNGGGDGSNTVKSYHEVTNDELNKIDQKMKGITTNLSASPLPGNDLDSEIQEANSRAALVTELWQLTETKALLVNSFIMTNRNIAPSQNTFQRAAAPQQIAPPRQIPAGYQQNSNSMSRISAPQRSTAQSLPAGSAAALLKR